MALIKCYECGKEISSSAQICLGCGAPVKTVLSKEHSSDIIGFTIKIINVEVMTKDMGCMNWEDAIKMCKILGGGWHLPTKAELNLLYQNKDKIGGFAGNFYWSSSENIGNFACSQNFFNGNRNGNCNKTSTYYVRAVRLF